MIVVINAHHWMDSVFWTVRGILNDDPDNPLVFDMGGRYEAPDAPTLRDEVDYLCIQIRDAIADLEG